MTNELLRRLLPAGNDPVVANLTNGYLIFLLLIFAVFFLLYICRILSRYAQVRSYVGFIRSILKEGSSNLPDARRRMQSAKIGQSIWAKNAVKTFQVTWEDARLQGEEAAVMPVRLLDFLPVDTVLDGVRNRRIAEALPGVFVSLGILGTFLGLVMGLSDLQLDKIDQLTEGVGHLISGLSLAFSTSLMGITLSIVYSLTYRKSISALEISIVDLDRETSILFPCQSYERYVRKYYELQSDVKLGLQTLATDVATQISGAIGPKMGEALNEYLVPAIQELSSHLKQSREEAQSQQSNMFEGFGQQLSKMSSVITEHFESSQQQQSEAMESVLKQYVDHMNTAFQSQFTDMARIIEETTASQSEMKAQLGEFSKHIQGQFEVQQELIAKTSRAGEILGESLESLESISKKLKSSADDIASVAQLLESAALSAKEGQHVLRESMERQIEVMLQTREELENTWKNITENSSSVVEHIQNVISELSKDIGENMTLALNAFDGKVAEVVERFSGTLFETSQTIEEFPAIMSSLDENLKTISESISESKDIVQDLKDTTTNLVADNINKAVEATIKLNESVVKISETSQDIHTFSNDGIEVLKTGVESFEEQNRATMQQLSEISGDLIRVQFFLSPGLSDWFHQLSP